jgi:hypothetical protein
MNYQTELERLKAEYEASRAACEEARKALAEAEAEVAWFWAWVAAVAARATAWDAARDAEAAAARGEK